MDPETRGGRVDPETGGGRVDPETGGGRVNSKTAEAGMDLGPTRKTWIRAPWSKRARVIGLLGRQRSLRKCG